MRRGRHTAARLAPSLAFIVFVAAGCIGEQLVSPRPAASPTPSRDAAVGSPVAPTAMPGTPEPAQPAVELGCADLVKPDLSGEHVTMPPVVTPDIARADARSARAIADAATRLAGLDSYQFTIGLVGREPIRLEPLPMDLGMQGTLTRADGLAVDALFGTRLREPDGSAAVSSGSRFVLGDDYVWGLDNVSEVLEPMPREGVAGDITVYLPEGLAERMVVPFAAGFERLGEERRGGVDTVRYRATTAGAESYAAAFRYEGQISADVWIAREGGYLAGATIEGTAQPNDPIVIELAVTMPNDPGNVVEPPATPQPDPQRPTVAPVDLRLEYQVRPDGQRVPTPAEIDQIGVTIRRRLDVSVRPVSVETSGTRITVIVCNTTRPEADRRLIEAGGALTAVALPARDFGTATTPGPMPPPAAGARVDPSLEPITAPSRAELARAHVDPDTGQRGIAFRLGNEASDAFRTYAAQHPGEYVAVVLDGVVLAAITIDDRLSRGHFVVTGDYTEAESRNLASWLSSDPQPFPLDLVHSLEQPTTLP